MPPGCGSGGPGRSLTIGHCQVDERPPVDAAFASTGLKRGVRRANQERAWAVRIFKAKTPQGANTMSSSDIKIPADPLLNCPACGLPAEITDRFILDGVPAPVEHVKLVCVRGHWYTPPVEELAWAESDRQPARHAGPRYPTRASRTRRLPSCP